MTQAFNLSQLANNVNTSGQLNAAAGLYNQLPVANGGTGLSTATGALVGAGSTISAIAASTLGNVLTSNGTTWTSAAAQGGPAPIVRIYTSPSPWTKPATLKGVKVTVVSAGGGGGGASISGTTGAKGGGGGATAFGAFASPAIPGPVTVTVGTGGAAGPTGVPGSTYGTGTAGGSSSFGALVTCTGGGAGTATPSPIRGNGASLAGTGGSFTPSPAIWGQNGYPADAFAFGSIPINYSNLNYFQGGASGFGFGMGLVAISAPQTPFTNSQYPQPAPSINAGIGFGGGGSGGTAAPIVGMSAGQNGIVIVEEFY